MTTLAYPNMSPAGAVPTSWGTNPTPLGASPTLGFGSIGSYGTAAPTATMSTMGTPAGATAYPVAPTVPTPSSEVMSNGYNVRNVTQDILDNQKKGFLQGTFMNEGGGLNLDAIGSLAEGIGALGSIWSGFQANKVAKDALNFQKQAYGTNLANQIQSYNTALEDRTASRAAFTGASQAEVDAYIAKNRMKG